MSFKVPSSTGRDLIILSSAGSAMATSDVHSTQVFLVSGYAHLTPDGHLSEYKFLEGTEGVTSYSKGHTMPVTVLRFLQACKKLELKIQHPNVSLRRNEHSASLKAGLMEMPAQEQGPWPGLDLRWLRDNLANLERRLTASS